MKYILIIFLFAFCNKSISQIPQPNTHIPNNFINKFSGTWQWVSSSDTMILKVAKVQYYYSEAQQSSEDLLLGCHKYIKNGTPLESSLERYDSVISNAPKRNTIYCWNMDDMDSSLVEGIFKDITKNKRGELKLTYLNVNPPQLVWELKNTRGLSVTLPGDPPFDFNFTLPRYMILTKIQ